MFGNSLVRSFGSIVPFDDRFAFAAFFYELRSRDKEIHHHPPLGCVESIEFIGKMWLCHPLISDVLSYQGPVFFFDMCIVIFLVRPASSELHRSFSMSEVFEDVPI